jgi:hypothetical protein
MIAFDRPEKYDSHWYAHHDHPPLPVLRVAFEDPQHTWCLHRSLDRPGARSARYGGRRYRWWFNALHRLDFSWLAAHRVLWHVTVSVLCMAGLTISISGTVIGWRRLRRKRHGA